MNEWTMSEWSFYFVVSIQCLEQQKNNEEKSLESNKNAD